MKETYEEAFERICGKDALELNDKIINGELTVDDIKDMLLTDAATMQQINMSANLETLASILIAANIVSAETYTQILSQKKDIALDIAAKAQFDMLMSLKDSLVEMKAEYEESQEDDDSKSEDKSDIWYEA